MKDYKKILENVVNIINTTEKSDIGFANICTYIGENCPELKESEDERIRKAIVATIHLYYGEPLEDEAKEMIAWLEKQKTSEEALQYLRENHSSSEMSDFQAAMNIAVAKAYDKGYNDGLEKQGENTHNKELSELLHKVICRFINDPNIPYTEREKVSMEIIPYVERLEQQGENNMGISETTKQELEDNLNKALEKETPESCNEILEKQGEQKPVIEMKSVEESLGIDSDTYNKIVDECIYGEQKSTELAKGEDYGIDGLWHAQRILEKTLGEVDGYQTDDGILDHKAAITAVKKLYGQKPTDNEMKEALRTEYEKGRADAIAEIQNPAWSEEDDTKIKSIITFLKSPSLCAMDGNKGIIDENIKYLKSLKGKVQPKQEWSEEDIRNIENIDSVLFYDKDLPEDTCVRLRNWLKSLKDRYSWKPSDEQLEALKNAIHLKPYENPSDSLLWGLYEQLKTLKEY